MTPGETYRNRKDSEGASESRKRVSVTEEDYLKIMNELIEYKGFASFSDISHTLGVRRQSVRDEINRLINSNLIEKSGKGRYLLTAEGNRMANIFLRKHRVAEILLNRCIGIPWEDVDEQAMGIEHGMTEEIIENTMKKFGSTRCPHGNPIPDVNGNAAVPDDMDISTLDGEHEVVFSRVIYESRDILKFLSSINVYPDSRIKFINDGKYYFEIDGKRIEISADVLKAIRFTVIK